jgi:hypothetical protein
LRWILDRETKRRERERERESIIGTSMTILMSRRRLLGPADAKGRKGEQPYHSGERENSEKE